MFYNEPLGKQSGINTKYILKRTWILSWRIFLHHTKATHKFSYSLIGYIPHCVLKWQLWYADYVRSVVPSCEWLLCLKLVLE